MSKKPYHHGSLREALLQVAESVLNERGAEAFSLRAVAKQAGVSHGAPAHHFNNCTELLSELAAIGYERLIEAQHERREKAESDAASKMLASGLGYIDFAVDNPELFRLMFTSQKPNRENQSFSKASRVAFNQLLDDVHGLTQKDPNEDQQAMQRVISNWAQVHGLAELIIAGRVESQINLTEMSTEERDKVITAMIIPIIEI